MRRRLLIVCVLLFVLGTVAAYAFDPAGRLKGWIGGEPFFAGRSTSAWLADLRSEDANERARAAEQLQAGGSEALPVLTQLLQQPGDPEPRWRAAEALGRLGPAAREAGPLLIAALEDPDPLVADVSAKALAKLVPDVPGAVPALVRRFPDVEAIRAVAAFKGDGVEAVPALIPLLQHSDPTIRRNTARTLGRIGAGAMPAVPALIEQLDDADPMVRAHAADALGGIGPAAASAVPALVRCLKDPEASVRRDVVRALGLMKAAAAAAAPALAELSNDPSPEVKKEAERALRLLKDTDLSGTRRNGQP